MAQYSFAFSSWAPAAQADTTTLTASKFQAIQGAAAPFIGRITECLVSGEAVSAAVNILLLARDTTVFITPTALATGQTVAGLNPSSPTKSSLTCVNATTTPQRSATAHLLTLSFNAFGGIIRWAAAPGEELYYTGATQPNGELSLSGFTGSGTGQMSSHIVFEEM